MPLIHSTILFNRKSKCSPPYGKAPARRGGRSTENQVLSGNGKQVIEQGNQSQADDGDTSSGHELYHGELVVKGFLKFVLLLFLTKMWYGQNKKAHNPNWDCRRKLLCCQRIIRMPVTDDAAIIQFEIPADYLFADVSLERG